jgi:hypothetical protein
MTAARTYIGNSPAAFRRAVCALLLTAIAVWPVYAQSGISASLSGTVTDSTGALLANADVEVTNADEGAKRSVKTTGNGNFSIVALKPGKYLLMASHAGFNPAIVSNITLSANDVLFLQVVLKPAGRVENVTVNDRPSLINLSPTVSSTIDQQLVSALPIDGRSIQSLITLSPGVQLAPIAGGGANPGQFSVNGMRSDSNYFTVDGVSANFRASGVSIPGSAGAGATPATNSIGSFGNLVSVDGLQEIQIQTSTYSPEFGRSPGAQISLVTRAGTEKFHGALYDYFRNDALDATDWFSNYLDTGKTALRYNDFGGVFGGPVLLPKYDGRKHHTFFFFSYEGHRFVLPQPAVVSVVPDVAARQNAPSAATKEILSAFPTPNGAEIYAQPFSIGLDQFGIFGHLICTQGSSPDCQPFNEAYDNTGYSNPSSENVWSLRLDQQFRDKYMFFARYNHARDAQTSRNDSGEGDAANLGNNDMKTDTLTIGATQAFTSRLINQFTINGSSQTALSSETTDNYKGAVPLPTSVLIPTSTCNGCSGSVTLNTIGPISSAVVSLAGPSTSKTRQINGVDHISYKLGDHQLKFGGDYRYVSPITPTNQLSTAQIFDSVSALETDSLFVGDVGYSSGYAIAYKTLSTYAQDTWKALPKLTLDYGVRWEINPAPTGKNGKTPLTVQSLNQNTTDFSYLQFAPAGTPLYKTSYTDFAPRFGFAYLARQASGHELVLRGGAGMFYDLGQTGFGAISFPNSQTYSLAPYSVGDNVPGYPTLTLPVPAAYAQGPAPNLTPSPSNPAQVTVAVSNYKLPRSYEGNLTLEQSLGHNTVFSIAYVGSISRDTQSLEQYTLQEVCGTPGLPAGSSCVPPGTANVATGTNFKSLAIIGNQGFGSYNSLQAKFHSRFTKQFESMASFTWSHAVDNGSNDAVQVIPSGIANPNINRGDSDYDVRSSFSEALTYKIPSLRWHNPLSYIAQNWSLNNLLSLHTALPFDVESDNSIVNYTVTGGYYAARADVVPGVPQWLYSKDIPGTQTPIPGGKYLNYLAFANAACTGGAICNGANVVEGNLRRNLLRGFGLAQLDLGVQRRFPVTESAGFQFRAELFNIANHPNFSNPGLSGTNTVDYPDVSQVGPGGPSFGFGESTESISSGLGGYSPLFQQGGPRAVQLALRFEF